MAPCTPRRQRRRRVGGWTARFRFNKVAVGRADGRWCWVSLSSSSSSVVETVLLLTIVLVALLTIPRFGARGLFGLGGTTRLDECWLVEIMVLREDRVVRLWRTRAAALLVVVVVEVETLQRRPAIPNPASRWMDFLVPLRVVTRDDTIVLLLRFTLAPTRCFVLTGTCFC